MTSSKTLLFVEDSKFFRNVIERNIRKELPDIEILTAGTYKAAQELIDKHKNDIFLSLLDLNLPDAPDGEIVDFVVEQKIPAVVFSASYTEDIRDRVLSQNVLDYVVKDSPASLDYITNLIRRVHRNRNRNISALVVDDARTARKYVADLLRLYQFNVLEAADGVEALEIIKSNNNIKLVITDYNMPNMDGFKLIKESRRIYSREELSIIGISSSGSGTLSARFIKIGANDFINKPFLREEFFCRVCQNVDAIEHIEALVDASSKDFMTGLYNRRYLFNTGVKMFETMIRGKSQPVVAVLDLDFFKKVNDTHGHEVGDLVLKHISTLLNDEMRRGTDIAVRLGGEEFCILAQMQSSGDAAPFFEKIRTSIEAATIETLAGDIPVTASIGVCNETKETLEDMITAADAMVYKAKEGGRNQVCITG
jgi:diguanylate cyclase (GGDEF)-like protein